MLKSTLEMTLPQLAMRRKISKLIEKASGRRDQTAELRANHVR